MANAIKGQTLVTNTRTGQQGIFIARWLNQVTGQFVVNVKCNGRMASWNEGEAA